MKFIQGGWGRERRRETEELGVCMGTDVEGAGRREVGEGKEIQQIQEVHTEKAVAMVGGADWNCTDKKLNC